MRPRLTSSLLWRNWTSASSKVKTFTVLLMSRLSALATATVLAPHVLLAAAILQAAATTTTVVADTIAAVLATTTQTIVAAHHLATLTLAMVDTTIVTVAMAVLQAEVHHHDGMMGMGRHVAATTTHTVLLEGMTVVTT